MSIDIQSVVKSGAAELSGPATGRVRVAGAHATIVAGLLMPYLNQAARMFETKYASRDDIDAAMRLGCGLPNGPLQLIDLIGTGVVHDILNAMHAGSGDARHAPADVLRQLTRAGQTGVAAGTGFYTYQAPGSSKALTGPDPSPSTKTPAIRHVSSVGVAGSGTMATGIIEVFAKAGYQVTFVARSQAKVKNTLAAIATSLARAVTKGKLSSDARNAALARVTGAASRAALSGMDLVIEAVAEDLAVKRELFAILERVCKPGAIIATTTSSLPVAELAAVTSRPADVIGMHFFNPAVVMNLVEVVDTGQTAVDVTATVLEICATMGKHPVKCGDRAGFIVNALLFPYLNDAIGLLAAGDADAGTIHADAGRIDAAITSALGYPMGPLALIDVVGVDVTLAIQHTLHQEFREPGFEPAPLLKQLVAAGYLGRKSGRGFHAYA